MKKLELICALCVAMLSAVTMTAQESNTTSQQEESTTLEALELLPPPAVKISDIPAYNNYFNANPLVKKVSLTTEKTISTTETPAEAAVATPVTEAPAEVTVDFEAPDFATIKKENASKKVFSLAEARRVATNDLFPAMTQVYFIQLASLTRSNGNASIFSNLTSYGNIYKVKKSGKTKIKLGYFYDRGEAERILSAVKSRGYGDAFLTEDVLNTTELELVLSSYDTPSTTSSTSYSSSSYGENSYTKSVTQPVKYKVRLASYEDPIWFDIETARTLGTIEQWTKGDWTIFVLSSYNTYDSAVAAKARAVAKGFSDAEVVVDNNGVLERIK